MFLMVSLTPSHPTPVCHTPALIPKSLTKGHCSMSEDTSTADLFFLHISREFSKYCEVLMQVGIPNSLDIIVEDVVAA